MGILTILGLVASALEGVLSALGKFPNAQKLIPAIQSALNSITTVQNQVVTESELESLRTKTLW